MTTRVRRVALTGGIATGKTAFLEALRKLVPDASSFDADRVARVVTGHRVIDLTAVLVGHVVVTVTAYRHRLVVADHAAATHEHDAGGRKPEHAPQPEVGKRVEQSPLARVHERLRSEAAQLKLAEMRASEPGRFGDVVLTPPSLLFEQQLAIDGGDLTLQLFATPGHKPDHIAIFIPEIRTLLPGDAAELPFPFVESAATLPAMRDSLGRMAALNAETALYCHAPVDSGPALLRQNMAYFDTIEQRCRAALARGAPGMPDPSADVEALVGFPFAEAVHANADAAALEGFYRPGHQAAIRAMLEHLVS